MGETIRMTLAESGVSVEPEALAGLADQLGADRSATRRELEKLALYAGPGDGRPGGRVDLEAAAACVGDIAGLSLDDALFAATVGDVPTTDRALELALAEGATAVGVLRAALMHLQRLHRTRLAMDRGISAAARLSRRASNRTSGVIPTFRTALHSLVRPLARHAGIGLLNSISDGCRWRSCILAIWYVRDHSISKGATHAAQNCDMSCADPASCEPRGMWL